MYQMKNMKNAVYTNPKTEILVTGVKDRGILWLPKFHLSGIAFI